MTRLRNIISERRGLAALVGGLVVLAVAAAVVLPLVLGGDDGAEPAVEAQQEPEFEFDPPETGGEDDRAERPDRDGRERDPDRREGGGGGRGSDELTLRQALTQAFGRDVVRELDPEDIRAIESGEAAEEARRAEDLIRGGAVPGRDPEEFLPEDDGGGDR